MAGNSGDSGRAGHSDEEWARFMEQAAAEAGDAPKEPSARARMVAERLRREQGQEPPGWRTGPAWQEMRGRGRNRRLKAALAVLLVAGLALVAVRPELVIDRITGKAEARQDAKNAAPLPAESIRPTAPPSAAHPDQPTLAEPFRGSPALQWADGAAGIELPEATAVGGMTKAQVADALEKTKQFLIAANLDPATLRGERPAAALALLDPKDDKTPKDIATSFERPTFELDPLSLFTRYDPADLKLVGDAVKVRGRMWVEPGESAGRANVKVDYSFVYPFTKVKGGSQEVSRTIVRREATFSVADPRKWDSTPGALWLVTYQRDIANSACDRYDGYVHPSFRDDAPSGPTPSGTPVDPYDRSKTIDQAGQDGCGVVSRT
ncbi:hypothetical protein ACFWBN_16170 [Streptomyces sp. NPDC059989]|uniref:hypothetical protein n=1 Tax=Streptomyces sp. NPDC059989 TaxID=3347026 RepID=UPI00368DC6CE